MCWIPRDLHKEVQIVVVDWLLPVVLVRVAGRSKWLNEW